VVAPARVCSCPEPFALIVGRPVRSGSQCGEPPLLHHTPFGSKCPKGQVSCNYLKIRGSSIG